MLELYTKLINSAEYEEFKNSNPQSYLSHISLIDEKNASSGWEFGFFNPNDSKITVIEGESLNVREPDEALSEDGDVKELDLNKVKISGEVALAQAEKVAGEKGVKVISKKIIILQNKDGYKWNITLLTADFKIFNVKIDAISGEILENNLSTVFDLGLQQS